MKERIETEIEKRVELCPTPVSALKDGDVKWFYIY